MDALRRNSLLRVLLACRLHVCVLVTQDATDKGSESKAMPISSSGTGGADSDCDSKGTKGINSSEHDSDDAFDVPTDGAPAPAAVFNDAAPAAMHIDAAVPAAVGGVLPAEPAAEVRGKGLCKRLRGCLWFLVVPFMANQASWACASFNIAQQAVGPAESCAAT
jgi:hypothetical protein